MLTQTDGQMYLSNARGITNRSTFRSFHTFNHGRYFDESRKAFGNLLVCNDDTLAASNDIITSVTKDIEVIIIPVVGSIEVKDNNDIASTIEAGQAFILRLKKGEYYQISNPYKDELVNFLQIWLEQAPIIENQPKEQISFDLDNNKNKLQSIGENCYIGKFTGRDEGHLTIEDSNKGAFAFIIEGAFEFQNRLLEARDSLALWNEGGEHLQIEFEALSNDAIVLIVEVAIKGGISF